MTQTTDFEGKPYRGCAIFMTYESLARALGLPSDAKVLRVYMDNARDSIVLVVESIELPIQHPGDAMTRVKMTIDQPALSRLGV